MLSLFLIYYEILLLGAMCPSYLFRGVGTYAEIADCMDIESVTIGL